MELEQLSKQVDWLDDERRKDKLKIGAFEERLTAVEGNVPPLAHQIKDLEGKITRLEAFLSRFDTTDETILQVRIDTKQQFEDLDKQIKKRDEESEKVRRTEVRALEISINEIRKELEQFPEIRRTLKLRIDEESRLARLIDEVRTRVETLRRSEEEYTRSIRLLDDGRRQDAKRLTDLTGEVAAIRKRVDDHSGRVELSANSLKNSKRA